MTSGRGQGFCDGSALSYTLISVKGKKYHISVSFRLLCIAYLFGQMLEVFGTLNVTPLCIGPPIRVQQFNNNFRSIFHESVLDLFHNFRAGIGGCSRGPRTTKKMNN